MKQNQPCCTRRCTRIFLRPSSGEICCDGPVYIIAITEKKTEFTIRDIEDNLPLLCQYPERRSLITPDFQEKLDSEKIRQVENKYLFIRNHP
jgi:hypothetical protein